MKIKRMDHVGINVEDMAAAKAFFIALGMEVRGEAEMEGEFVEKVIGLTGVRDTLVMMGVPGGEAAIELVQFHNPKDANGRQPSHPNTLGIRHICLNVEDIEAAIGAAKEHGGELMGEVLNYKNVYKNCYVRGPEGIIVELAEEIG